MIVIKVLSSDSNVHSMRVTITIFSLSFHCIQAKPLAYVEMIGEPRDEASDLAQREMATVEDPKFDSSDNLALARE